MRTSMVCAASSPRRSKRARNSSQLGGKTTIAPNLLGIEVNGQLAVIYSPYGMCGGWEMAQNPYALGYDDAGSLSLGENMLMHTMTH